MLISMRVNRLMLFVLTLAVFPTLVMSQSLDSEYNLDRYESEFTPVPTIDDARWQVVPVEEWEKTFQFLTDSANSNLERLIAWNASYNLVTGRDLSSMVRRSPDIKERVANFPSYAVDNQTYSFYRDNKNDKSYISLTRQGNLIFYNNQYVKEDYDYFNPENPLRIESNLKAIITADRLLLYEYDSESRRSEALQQLGYEEFGKTCVVLPPDSACVSSLGTIFDPRFFYYQDGGFSYKHWSDLELVLPLEVKAYLNKKDDGVTQRIKVHKALINNVEWFRIEHGITNGVGLFASVYYFNSESGYNIVSSSSMRDGIERSAARFEYENVNNVYIPKRYLHEYYKHSDTNSMERKSFRYFDLVRAEVNKPIPAEQFAMDALGLDDDVVIYDQMDGKFYAYEKGKEKSEPLARFDDLPNGVKLSTKSTPLWRSPVRMTALCVGLCLLFFGVIYKVRRKRASS